MTKIELDIIRSIISILIVLIGFVLIQPYIEMKTFNKFSDEKVTYIEAMFTNLRVFPEENKNE